MAITKVIKVGGDPIVAYINLWNGMWKLTDNEISVLAILLKSYLKLKEDGLKEPYLSRFLFSTENRKDLKTELDKMSDQSLTNYIASLKKKGIIVEKEGVYVIDERVIPVKSITFEFNDNR